MDGNALGGSFLPFPSTASICSVGGNQTQFFQPAKAARSPGMESVVRQEQMAFALYARGFLFPRAWLLGVSLNIMAAYVRSVMQSPEEPAGRLLSPTVQEGELEDAHFGEQIADVAAGDVSLTSGSALMNLGLFQIFPYFWKQDL